MNLKERMIDFLLYDAEDDQIERFFDYIPRNFNEEDIKDVLCQMPDDTFEELIDDFELR